MPQNYYNMNGERKETIIPHLTDLSILEGILTQRQDRSADVDAVTVQVVAGDMGHVETTDVQWVGYMLSAILYEEHMY